MPQPLLLVGMISPVETAAPCLLSVSILLRHGARGPGGKTQEEKCLEWDIVYEKCLYHLLRLA